MDTINRSVAVIKPKQPLVDWLNSLPNTDPPFMLAVFQIDCTVLLLPEYDSEHQIHKCIKKIYNKIFEKELHSLCTDPSYWPSKRDYKTFLKWFSIVIHSEVFDTVDKAIIKKQWD